MSNREPEFLDPGFEPGEFDRMERELRTTLAQETRRVHPSDRLDAILHEANQAGPLTATGGHGTRRWLVPVAAAAAVAAIIGGIWWTGQDDQPTVSPPAGTSTAVTPAPTTATPSTSPSATATDQPTSATSTAGATRSTLLPVYYVGPIGDAKPTYKLFREFLTKDLPETSPAPEVAKAALAEALQAQRFSNTDGYLQPWAGQSVLGVTYVPGTSITIDLANAGNPAAAATAEVRRLAVQELVWTAQAAIQDGNLPVRITVQGAPARLFGTISTDQPFTRPPGGESWRDLAPIWVVSPNRDEVLPRSKPVVVKGQATVFEATLAWQLTRGGAEVKSGSAMASVGAPERGDYSIDLGRLPAGDYTISVTEPSAKDGSVAAQATRSFTVK